MLGCLQVSDRYLTGDVTSACCFHSDLTLNGEHGGGEVISWLTWYVNVAVPLDLQKAIMITWLNVTAVVMAPRWLNGFLFSFKVTL